MLNSTTTHTKKHTYFEMRASFNVNLILWWNRIFKLDFSVDFSWFRLGTPLGCRYHTPPTAIRRQVQSDKKKWNSNAHYLSLRIAQITRKLMSEITLFSCSCLRNLFPCSLQTVRDRFIYYVAHLWCPFGQTKETQNRIPKKVFFSFWIYVIKISIKYKMNYYYRNKYYEKK